VANDLVHFKRPGEDLTAQATAAITGKRFVVVSGNRTSGPGLAPTAEGSNYRVAPFCHSDLAAGRGVVLRDSDRVGSGSRYG
jgi:hypothetical protein